MKSFPSLILTGVCATLFTGCYLDRQPTVTLEDKMFSDEPKGNLRAAIKATPATYEEYALATGHRVKLDAFDVPVEPGKPYRAFFFLKYHDLRTETRGVEALLTTAIGSSGRQTRMLVRFDERGLRVMFPASAQVVESPAENELVVRYADWVKRMGSGVVRAEGDVPSGTPLPLLQDASQRFLVRRVWFMTPRDPNDLRGESDAPISGKLVDTSGVVFEIECVVMPVGAGSNDQEVLSRVKSSVNSEWAPATSR